ncbi:hypothetical protein SAMN00120144_3896 [Hymenobacter roseosalivarius DSM 11622]|uniref:Uncharacterized protein n=1 Tax=Hymenobacter roseosalivarius DSM 11622 TaxID=645990 RepID=A0A1W1UGI8_9BACT|nr:hypothetical protein [Hymenobacter roseosalivarius]SMB80197.1 hypothetical protein SAMN00120144_3896 [Hymenobacter roseosalivarius DSM 11622]
MYHGQIHFPTIGRDRIRDYGGNFNPTFTDTKTVMASQTFSAQSYVT